MYAYKDILELAGVTTRIYGLLSTLHSIPPVNPYKITEDLVSLSATDIIVNERREVDPETGFQREEDVLVKDLSFELKAGEHLMITGANGVGKSAIARVLKGLWDGRGGTMKRPVDCPTGVDNGMQQGIFFVPQRPYHVTGTLLDQ
jgi:ATP-binding cassette, subfamily D (ALD), peroxisomal long-chain fatty acid import protein